MPYSPMGDDPIRRLPIRSVLAASDLSEGSDPAVAGAARLAERLGAALHLVHSMEFSVVPYSAMGASAEFQQQTEDARRRLEQQADRILSDGPALASALVRIGSAADAILERAGEIEADLIVIGPARPRAFRGPILGNTADHVIRRSRVPLLVLPGSLQLPLREVVVPIDLDDPARGAIDQGLLWATALSSGNAPDGSSLEAGAGSRLRLVYFAPEHYRSDALRFDNQIALPQLQLECEDARGRTDIGSQVDTAVEVRWGNVASEAIVEHALTTKADLLVLGTHGYGALGRAFIGSVASRVVRAGPCPMLLIPPSMWAPAGPQARS